MNWTGETVCPCCATHNDMPSADHALFGSSGQYDPCPVRNRRPDFHVQATCHAGYPAAFVGCFCLRGRKTKDGGSTLAASADLSIFDAVGTPSMTPGERSQPPPRQPPAGSAAGPCAILYPELVRDTPPSRLYGHFRRAYYPHLPELASVIGGAPRRDSFIHAAVRSSIRPGSTPAAHNRARAGTERY